MCSQCGFVILLTSLFYKPAEQLIGILLQQLFYENVFGIIFVYKIEYTEVGLEMNVICLLVNFLNK
jgi:hypothetical protein